MEHVGRPLAGILAFALRHAEARGLFEFPDGSYLDAACQEYGIDAVVVEESRPRMARPVILGLESAPSIRQRLCQGVSLWHGRGRQLPLADNRRTDAVSVTACNAHKSRCFRTMSVLQEVSGLLRLRALQLFALSSLLILMAAIAFDARTTVRDPDIWWHLKAGDWIVEHHAVPYVGIFSRTWRNSSLDCL